MMAERDEGEGEGGVAVEAEVMSKEGDGVSELVALAGGADVVDVKHRTEAVLLADQLRMRVLKLRDQMGESYFEMGRLLHRINREGLYTHWKGPDGRPYQHFSEYVEHEVDFAFRKAKYLMSIWWWFAEELGDQVVMEKIKQVGWTKAAMLVGVVDGKNVDLWLNKAKVLGVKELGDETRMAKEAAARGRRPARPAANSGPAKPSELSMSDNVSDQPAARTSRPLPVPLPETSEEALRAESRVGVDPLSDDEARDHRSRWTVLLSTEQRVNVERAIDVAAAMAAVEADGKGFLLDLVATAFLTTHSGTVGNNEHEHKLNFEKEVRRDASVLFRSMERLLGVDIVAIDRKTSAPVYGMEAIERMAAMDESRAS